MSDNLPNWRTARPRHGWASPDGLRKLKSLIKPLSPFTPDDDQFGLSAQVMDEQNVLVIRATGSGKTMIIIIPLLARKGTMALIIAPLNSLESDMAQTFQSFGLSTVVINRYTLRQAAKRGRNLWAEARRTRALFMGPEHIPTDEFDDWRNDPYVRSHLALSVTEEVHVLDLWADEFREAYKLIPALRARLPPSVTFIGLTATCRPGLQTTAIVKGMGFDRSHIHIHRGDCERHDLNIIVRPIYGGVSGTKFPDLDWLVPSGATATDLISKKTLVYCNTIKLGHRVTRHLRSLLPPDLRSHQFSLIRHAHSLCCDDCKKDALDALCERNRALPCAIEVATDVVGFGVDARHIQRVVCFDVPDELNTLVQRMGRAGRDELTENATAFIYLKKTTMVDALTTHFIEDGIPADQVDELRTLHNTVREVPTQAKRSRTRNPKESAMDSLIASLQRASAKPKIRLDADSRARAMIAVVQASMVGYCITLRLNQLYGNPGDKLCGRCSSCTTDTLPRTRTAVVPDDTPLADVTNITGSAIIAKPRACMRKELVAEAIGELQSWARHEWLSSAADTSTFLDSSAFLGPRLTKTLARNVLRLDSRDRLQNLVGDWKWWESHGDSLWDSISRLRSKYSSAVRQEQQAAMKKRKRERYESDEESSDKENATISAAAKRRRNVRDYSPSPPYIPPARETRSGRRAGLANNPNNLYTLKK